MFFRNSFRTTVSIGIFMLVAIYDYRVADAKWQQHRPIPKPKQIPKNARLIPDSLDKEAREEARKCWGQFFNSTWVPGVHYTLRRDKQTIGPSEKQHLPLMDTMGSELHRLTLVEIRDWYVDAKRTIDFIDKDTLLNDPDLQWRGEIHSKAERSRMMPPRELAGAEQNPFAPIWSPYKLGHPFQSTGLILEKRAGQWKCPPAPNLLAPTDQQLENGGFKWNEGRLSDQQIKEVQAKTTEREQYDKDYKERMDSYRELHKELDATEREEERERVMKLSPTEHANEAVEKYIDRHFTECNRGSYTVEIESASNIETPIFRVLKMSKLDYKLEPLTLVGESPDVAWKGRLTISTPSHQVYYKSNGEVAIEQGAYIRSAILKLRNGTTKDYLDRVVSLRRVVFEDDPGSSFPLSKSQAPACRWLSIPQLRTVRGPSTILRYEQK